MLNFLLEPFNYPFMIYGLLAAGMVGIVCAVVGTFIVLRGMAFFGDALSHTILPGIAVGYLISGSARGSLFWWALGTAVVSALSIGTISRGTKIKEDTAIGIIFAGMFALGIALISTVQSYALDLSHFLFGDVLAVTPGDLLLIGIFSAVILLTILAFYKEFVVISFDPILATTLRLPGRLLEYLLLILIAMTIVVSLQTVGVALMVAMLVTPAATASLLTRRLPVMMALAALIGSLSGLVGLYLSFYIKVASGAAIVLVATAIFLVTFLFAPRRQVLARKAAGEIRPGTPETQV
jgi:manganese/iron transport system permease protein